MRHRLAVALLVVFCGYPLSSAQIPKFFIDSVVALGKFVALPNQPAQWVNEASGFLYGDPIDSLTDMSKHQYAVYLVTNRHVLTGQTEILVRINPESQTDAVRAFPLPLRDEHGSPAWFANPNQNIDVAVVRVDGNVLREQHLQFSFFTRDYHAATKDKMKDIGTSIGDDIFVLGFPMNLFGSANRNFVIARRGSIARIDNVLSGSDTTFLIDSFIFPGNSGGPVVISPTVTAIQGTKPQNTAFLIGIVRGYIPYDDVAVSTQTGQPRLLSQENSGLAEVIPVDYINETIDAAKQSQQRH